MKRWSFVSLGCLLLIMYVATFCTSSNKQSSLPISKHIGDLAMETIEQAPAGKNKEGTQAPPPPGEKKKVKPATPKTPGEKKEGQPGTPEEDWQKYEEYETQC